MVIEESPYFTAVTTVIRLCVERLDSDVDLDDLAKEAGYSPFHFHRIFSAIVGESPKAFVRRLRLERSALNLKNSDQTIGAIAMDSGYGTPDAFARAFRSAYGVLPSEFRCRDYDYRIMCLSQIHFGLPIHVRPQLFIGNEMNTRIENRPEYHLIGLSHQGAYWTIGRTFDELNKWVTSNPVDVRGLVAVFHDDPEKVEESQLRSEAAVVVPTAVPAPEGMVAYTIPAAKYLIGEYVGSYEGLGDAWKTLFGQDLPEKNVVPADAVCFEWYIDMMGSVPVEQLRTELFVPIQ